MDPEQRGQSSPRWRWLGVWTGALLLAGLLLIAGVIGSGVYNVAASSKHFAPTRWLLEVALRRSVVTHSLSVEDRAVDDMDLVRLGAGHYATGCAPCHGGPGEQRSPIVRSMLPAPPPLTEAARNWSDKQLFWIVKNGFKYTGMPAWPAQERSDEVWALVAFVRKLPDMSGDRYKQLASGNISRAPARPQEIIHQGSPRFNLTACARCHGDANAAPTSAFVPRLAGQSETYLARALAEYASGARPSGIMQPIAAELSRDEMAWLARRYSAMSREPSSAPAPAPARDLVERGARLATKGAPEAEIPGCLACHSGRASSAFPILAGQPQAFLREQLKAFARGARDETGYGAVMTAIAKRLDGGDIEAAAAYFASQEPPAPVGTLSP